MSREQSYIPVASGASAPQQSSRTVSQILSRCPEVDSLSLLPQFRIEYVYPENYIPICIETPADALMLFRALWEREEYKGLDKVYVLLLQRNQILTLQLLDISATLSRFLRISQVAKLAYFAGADNVILISTHRESEVEDFEQSELDFLLSLPEEFESFDLALTDCIRVGEDRNYSLFAEGYSEFAGFTPPDYYTWHRNYNLLYGT
ncbi:hypothetical protein [Larkinella terrae]|uniref:Uncharacterized protein n=1 Tax=Larkinella terrae TaxID=2025311 RepID=A0A7K0EHB0_9BACT|nr:hypothetical protein [Larkinella terrae]MRS61230.1 hypothetical protein [Larkinella terrae]